MAQQLINIGTTADDGTGDTFRGAFDKVNDNNSELFPLAENALSKTQAGAQTVVSDVDFLGAIKKSGVDLITTTDALSKTTGSAQTVVGSVDYTGGLLIDGVLLVPFDNFIVVKSESDLPASTNVGGVDTHVLEDKQYVINGNVSIVDPLGFPGIGNRATITAINRSVLTYTGGIALFRDPDAQGDIEITGLTEFRAPGAKMWELTASSGSFSFQSTGEADKFTNCESLGTVDCNGTSGFSILVGTLNDFNQGLVVTNSVFFEINTCFVFGNNAVGCTYFTVEGVSTVGSVNFDTMTVGNESNETLLDINTNIQSGIDAVNIRTNTQEGGINGTVLAAGSLTEKDNKVLAIGNSIIGDTVPGGLLSLTSNATDTTLAAVDTPTLVAGTWVVEEESQFTGTAGGRLTYDDARNLTVDIDVSISVEPSSGNGKVIRAYVAKNGVEITNSGKSTTADNGKAGNMSLSWRAATSTTDFYEVFVENKTDGIAITVIDCSLRIP